MEQLKNMKQCLVAQAQSQMGNLQCVDAEELGEVIDMIKDLEEAIYYCTIVEAMEGKNNYENEYAPSAYYYTEPKRRMRQMYPYYEDDRMYYTQGGGQGNGGSQNGSNMSSNSSMGGNRSYTERDMPLRFRDEREGRSPIHRKMYMESKQMHQDATTQMRELENYLHELSLDITEMVEDASPEEKKILRKKIETLATKIDA